MENLVIIGAGFSAAVLTEYLKEMDPLIIDKGRGPGGRCSSRRVEDIGIFDHGLQYVSDKNNQFLYFLKDKLKSNLVSWDGAFYNENNELNNSKKFIGKNGNNELVKCLLRSKKQLFKTKVNQLIFKDKYWTIILSDNKKLDTKKVIITIPEEQCFDLLGNNYQIKNSKKTSSNITLMIATKKNKKKNFAGRKFKDEIISWIANENSKNRQINNNSLSLYTIQSTDEFAEKNCLHYYNKKHVIKNEMLNKSLDILELSKSEVKHCDIHSWRLAYKKSDFTNDVIWDQNKGLGVCGDWISGAKLENSWFNAKKLAEIYNNS